jgi:ribosomal protein L11 methylase PrmA
MIWEESAPLVPDLARRLRSGGAAIFAGILDAREEEAAAGIAAAHLTIDSFERDGEWRTIVARKSRKAPKER